MQGFDLIFINSHKGGNMSYIEMVSDILDRIARAGTIIVITSMLVITAVQVFSRYLLHYSFFWSEDLVKYLFVWVVFLGGSTAFKKRSHMVVDIVINYVNGLLGTIIAFLANFVITVTLIALVYYGTKLAWNNIPANSITLDISMSIPYAIIPIGCLLMLIHHSAYIYKKIRPE
jgi:TRAP-type C4-dicarboxylate transport system permease small subunit